MVLACDAMQTTPPTPLTASVAPSSGTTALQSPSGSADPDGAAKGDFPISAAAPGQAAIPGQAATADGDTVTDTPKEPSSLPLATASEAPYGDASQVGEPFVATPTENQAPSSVPAAVSVPAGAVGTEGSPTNPDNNAAGPGSVSAATLAPEQAASAASAGSPSNSPAANGGLAAAAAAAVESGATADGGGETSTDPSATVGLDAADSSGAPAGLLAGSAPSASEAALEQAEPAAEAAVAGGFAETSGQVGQVTDGDAARRPDAAGDTKTATSDGGPAADSPEAEAPSVAAEGAEKKAEGADHDADPNGTSAAPDGDADMADVAAADSGTPQKVAALAGADGSENAPLSGRKRSRPVESDVDGTEH